jgi:hypothetical protein
MKKAKVDATELKELAKVANEAHRDCKAAFQDSVKKAKTAGEALQKVRDSLDYGEWGRWLKTNCPDISERTAQAYMQVARNWTKVTSKTAADAADSRAMSLRKFLSKAKSREGKRNGNHKELMPSQPRVISCSPNDWTTVGSLRDVLVNLGRDARATVQQDGSIRLEQTNGAGDIGVIRFSNGIATFIGALAKAS